MSIYKFTRNKYKNKNLYWYSRCFFLVVVFVFCIWDTVSCSPDWSWTHYIAEGDFELLIFLTLGHWGLDFHRLGKHSTSELYPSYSLTSVYSPAHALSRWHSDFYSYGVPWWALYFALLLKLLFRALVSQGLQTQGPRKAVNQSMKLTQNMVEGWRNSICLSPGKGTEPCDRHGNCVSIDIPNVVLALDPGPYTCQEALHRWALSPLHILCLQSLHPMRHFYTECAVWLPLVKKHVPADARSDFLKMLKMRKLRLLYKSCDFKILAFFKISYREAPKCHRWKLSLAHRLTGLILLT